MKIIICGSIQFGKEMIEVGGKLKELGHKVILPRDIEQYAQGNKRAEDKWAKIEGDLFKDFYEKLISSDAILIVNNTKNNVENYVGGNALIEMGLAHIFNKGIYLLNPIPKMSYSDEIEAMKPVVLGCDVAKLK